MATPAPALPPATVTTPAPAAVSTPAPADPARPRNRIQVSREKRPLYFFIGLAKKFLLSEDEVELSGLGLAVTTVVTVAEILKNSGHVVIASTFIGDFCSLRKQTLRRAALWSRGANLFRPFAPFRDFSGVFHVFCLRSSHCDCCCPFYPRVT